MHFLRSKNCQGIAKIEYIILIGASLIAIPSIGFLLNEVVVDETCEAEYALDPESDCFTTLLFAEDQETQTYEGISVELSLTDGAEQEVIRNSYHNGLTTQVAYAQGVERQTAPRSDLPSRELQMRQRDYRASERKALEDVLGEDPTRIRIKEVTLPTLKEKRLSRPDGSVPLGQGRIEKLDDNRVRFDPVSDFDELRSGESAVVEFGFQIQGKVDSEATARARVTVLGFHAEPDIVSVWRGQPVFFDVLVNDHLPEKRSEISLTSFTNPIHGSLTSSMNGVFSYEYPTTWNTLGSGEKELATFEYEIKGPMGVTDTAVVTIEVNGFSGSEDVARTYEQLPITIDVLANDNNGDSANLSIVGLEQPTVGQAAIVDNKIRFDPGPRPAGMLDGEVRRMKFSYVVESADGAVTDDVDVFVDVEAYSYGFRYSPWNGCSEGAYNAWSDWSACSTQCGPGTQTRSRTCDTNGVQTRTAECVRSDGQVVDNGFCGTPVVTQPCSASCSGPAMEQRSCQLASICTSAGSPCPPQNIINGRCQQNVCVPYQYCETRFTQQPSVVCQNVPYQETWCRYLYIGQDCRYEYIGCWSGGNQWWCNPYRHVCRPNYQYRCDTSTYYRQECRTEWRTVPYSHCETRQSCSWQPL